MLTILYTSKCEEDIKKGRLDEGGGEKMQKKKIAVGKPERLMLWIDKDNVILCEDAQGNFVGYPQEGYRNNNFAMATKAIENMYGRQLVWGLMRRGKNKWSIFA